MSANRVMKSVTSWLERKLFLKVSATKTKVVRPPESKFLGFTYLQRNGEWKCKPSNQSKMKLYDKCRRELIRRIGIARPIAVTFKRINQIVVGWINYYRIGVMKNISLMSLVNGFAIKSELSFLNNGRNLEESILIFRNRIRSYLVALQMKKLSQ